MEAIDYVHLHGCRLYMTVNTLVKEKEFSGVRETLRAIAAAKADAVIVTDVGQHQMFSARYSKFNRTRSFITSGGLGTMGFGLPAAMESS